MIYLFLLNSYTNSQQNRLMWLMQMTFLRFFLKIIKKSVFNFFSQSFTVDSLFSKLIIGTASFSKVAFSFERQAAKF